MSRNPMDHSLLNRLTDAHCHPTQHALWRENLYKTAQVKLGKIAVMSSAVHDQDWTTELANAFKDKVIPCYGVHPWFAHHISLRHPPPSKSEHYDAVFFPSDSNGTVQDQGYTRQELDSIFDQLPDPTSLHDMLSTLKQNLIDHPEAMLGEVGLDRSFRIPRQVSSNIQCDHTDDDEDVEIVCKPSSLRFTKLSTPIDHQIAVLRSQLHLAIDLQRNISMHSVRAQDITLQILDSIAQSRQDDWWGLDADVEFDEMGKEIKPPPSQRWKGGRSRKRVGGVKLDLHSYGGSDQTVKSITKKHPNVYFSFSTVINSRSNKLSALISSIPEDRLLVESDFDQIDKLDDQIEDMVRRVGEAKGWTIEETVSHMERNWREFNQKDDP